jgi:hypothetical protein
MPLPDERPALWGCDDWTDARTDVFGATIIGVFVTTVLVGEQDGVLSRTTSREMSP